MAITHSYVSLSDLRERAKAEVGKVVVGQGRAVELLLIAAMARGHVLLEGPPGTAKTLLGRATAYVLGADFNRVQFTPDTTPTELVGENVTRAGETKFVSGTIFTNVLLADEINRTPPRTQAALLEAMAERSVTVEGRVHRLPDPFLVIATQNPFEQEGVFPLPESNLDRFLFKIYIDYTDYEHEVDMLRLPHTGGPRTCSARSCRCSGSSASTRRASSSTRRSCPMRSPGYAIGVVRKTRAIDGIMLGASSRAAIHLMSATKANARLEGRDTVTIQDVRDGALRAPAPPHLRGRGPHARGRAADGPRRPRQLTEGAVTRPTPGLTSSRRAPARAPAASRPAPGARGTRTSPRGRSEARCPRSRAPRRRRSRRRLRARPRRPALRAACRPC